MSNYDPYNWFWKADDGRIYSSAVQALVGTNDKDRTNVWPRDEANNQTDASLQEVLAPYGGLFANLTYYAADARWRRQTGGVVVAGVNYKTDRTTLSERNNAYDYSLVDGAVVFQWKLPDGSFVPLNKAALTKVMTSENKFVQTCFTCEQSTVASIKNGSITTRAQVDAAFAAVSNVFS